MFSRKDCTYFIAGALLVLSGFVCMAVDPAPHGFGILTLWVAPPLLVAGFLLPALGLARPFASMPLLVILKQKPLVNAAAFVVFLVSFFTYLFTLEPTASLWDCSEFIASAFKLQVAHTPGNPLLILFGRIFAMFSFGDQYKVATCINAMSAIFSALTVSLIYFFIYELSGQQIKNQRTWQKVLPAITGSLCIAFSDTFWFSAVEAETYAASCFFLFLIVSLIHKGISINDADRRRLAVLIFYVAGLSFCIHPMCVLALPLLPVAWYRSRRPFTWKNITLSLCAGLLIVVGINRFVAIGVFEASFLIDLFMVNNLGLPFYSGAIVFLLAFSASVYLIIRRWRSYEAHAYCLLFVVAGFLPYLVLFIRSNHNPPIDESNPENLQLIKAYMNREGYPTRPLLVGPYFDAEVTALKPGQTVYYKSEHEYKPAGRLSAYEYEEGRQTILPRIYSQDNDHIETYRRWTGLKPGEKPDFVDNMTFMLRYQIGHMYLRYLMFNFAGRESDVQNSDWLRPWDLRTTSTVLPNRARNQYWMIPLLLGAAGACFQFVKHRRGFCTITTVFLISGLVLVVYLNSTPNEPRERDYIYVASYVAYAIWIGLGANAVLQYVGRNLQPVAAVLLLAVPAWMFYENFDDHNRSGRTFQRDQARNILGSCAPNAILFTGGDNDTFPLWYVQEVEGFRTDVRVMVLSYLNTDWYINQLRNEYYESKPFKLTLSRDNYRQYGVNDVLYVQEKIKDKINAVKFLELLSDDHPVLRVSYGNGDSSNTLPSRKLFVPLAGRANDQGTTLDLAVEGNFLAKNGLAILDILVNNPDRPLYFNFTSMTQTGCDIAKYLVQEGHLFRFNTDPSSIETRVDTKLTYDHLLTNSNYENLLHEGANFNYEDYQLRIIQPLLQSFNSLAAALIKEREIEKAHHVLDTAVKYFHQRRFAPSFASLHTANLFLNLNRKKDAEKLAKAYYDYSREASGDEDLQRYAEQILAETRE